MKILVATTSTGDTEHITESLRNLSEHAVNVFWYDKAFRDEELQLAMSRNNPNSPRQRGVNIAPETVRMDKELLAEAAHFRPDLIVYVSALEGKFVPSDQTMGELSIFAPIVHMLFDGGDPPWWPRLQELEESGIFDVTVSIDGNHDWPGGKDWMSSWRIKNGLTLLTPVCPIFYPPTPYKFSERPFPIGFAGNVGGWMRKGVVERMQQDGMPFVLRDREEPIVVTQKTSAGHSTYVDYAKFLQNCNIIINVPWTGSGTRKHVKGRVVEAGWAGACLLEWDNPHTRRWFTPRFHYEEYGNPQECVEAARMLIARPRRMAEMAAELHAAVKLQHAPQAFWEAVFDAVTWRKQRAAE